MNTMSFSRIITWYLTTEYTNSGAYATLYSSVTPTGFKRECGQNQ